MYIDTFLASVPTSDRQTYTEYANRIDASFLEFGATRVVDGWGHDVPRGTLTDLYRAVQATDSETVVFGWMEWPDKATRDAGWDRAMKDARMQGSPPFDGKRMIFGGFDAISIQEK